jgi:hypothetical protein
MVSTCVLISPTPSLPCCQLCIYACSSRPDHSLFHLNLLWHYSADPTSAVAAPVPSQNSWSPWPGTIGTARTGACAPFFWSASWPSSPPRPVPLCANSLCSSNHGHRGHDLHVLRWSTKVEDEVKTKLPLVRNISVFSSFRFGLFKLR